MGHRPWSPRTCKCHTAPWPRAGSARGKQPGRAWQLQPSAGPLGEGRAESPEEGSDWARVCSRDQHGNSSSKSDPVKGDPDTNSRDPTLHTLLGCGEFLWAQKPTLQSRELGKFWLGLLISGQKSSLTSFPPPPPPLIVQKGFQISMKISRGDSSQSIARSSSELLLKFDRSGLERLWGAAGSGLPQPSCLLQLHLRGKCLKV